MKLRRVIVQFEVETDVALVDLRKATMRVTVPGRIRYVEKNRVNVVRESTAARKQKKEKAK